MKEEEKGREGEQKEEAMGTKAWRCETATCLGHNVNGDAVMRKSRTGRVRSQRALSAKPLLSSPRTLKQHHGLPTPTPF